MKNLIIPLFMVGIISSVFSKTVDHNSSMNKINRTANEINLPRYYNFLHSIQELPLGSQIDSLRYLILKYPKFDRTYLKLLERFLISKQNEDAKIYFNKLSNDSSYYSNSNWVLAKVFWIENNPQNAFEHFHKAITSSSPSYLLIKDFLQFDHEYSGRFNGIEHVKKLFSDSEKNKKALLFYYSLNHKYEKGIELSKAFKIYELPVLHILGDCLYRSNQSLKADSVWRTGLAISRQNGDQQAESQFLTNLGVLARAKGQLDSALAYYKKSENLAEASDNILRLQLNAANKGNIFYIKNLFEKAAIQYKKAISLASSIGLHNYLSVWYSSLAVTMRQLGNYYEALILFDKCNEAALRTKNWRQIADIMLSKGNLYSDLNQTELAKRTYRQALEFAQKHHFKDYEAEAEVEITNLMINENNYNQARETCNQYLQILNSPAQLLSRAYWLGILANTYFEENQYIPAKQYFLQAAQTAEKVKSEFYSSWYFLKAKDIDVLEGKLSGALETYKSLSEKAKRYNASELLAEIDLSKGDVYRATDNLDSAIICYKEAASLIETQLARLKVQEFRIGYFSGQYKIYPKLIECYFERYKKEKSISTLDSLLLFCEMSRNRSLGEIYDQNKLENVDDTLAKQYKNIIHRIRVLQKKLRLLESEFISNSTLDSLYTQLEASRYSLIAQHLKLTNQNNDSIKKLTIKPPSVESIQIKLENQNTGLLFYSITEELSFVFATNGLEYKIINLPQKLNSFINSIDSLIAPLHTFQMNDGHAIPFRSNIAYKLYNTLLKPVEDELDLPKNLIIIPDIIIMNLPFDMLLTEKPLKAEYKINENPDYSNHFLLNRYCITYCPNFSFFSKKQGKTPKKPSLYVFSNPVQIGKKGDFRSSVNLRFSALPYSGVEAKNIANIYRESKVFSLEHATEASFLQNAKKADIIHIASHGFVDMNFDFFSGLVFSMGSDSTEDGLLMGYEISDLRLNTDLITLSACETGRGRLISGEGVMGLPRLFLNAGVSSIIMTLWKVDDLFSSRLMPKFYDYLLEQGLSKAEALQQAKLAVMNEYHSNTKINYQHPFFWASYSIYGKPEFPKQKNNLFKIGLIILVILISVMLTGYFLIYRRLFQ